MARIKAISAVLLAALTILGAAAVLADEEASAVQIDDIDIDGWMDLIPDLKTGDEFGMSLKLNEKDAYAVAKSLSPVIPEDSLDDESLKGMVEALEKSQNLDGFLSMMPGILGVKSVTGTAGADAVGLVTVSEDGTHTLISGRVGITASLNITITEDLYGKEVRSSIGLSIPLSASVDVRTTSEGVISSVMASVDSDIVLTEEYNWETIGYQEVNILDTPRIEKNTVPVHYRLHADVGDIPLASIEHVLNDDSGEPLTTRMFLAFSGSTDGYGSGIEINEPMEIPAGILGELDAGNTSDEVLDAILDPDNPLSYGKIELLLEQNGIFLPRSLYDSIVSPTGILMETLSDLKGSLGEEGRMTWFYQYDVSVVNGNNRGPIVSAVGSITAPTAFGKTFGDGDTYNLEYGIDEVCAVVSSVFLSESTEDVRELPESIHGLRVKEVLSGAFLESALTIPDSVEDVGKNVCDLHIQGVGCTVAVDGQYYDLYRVDGENLADLVGYSDGRITLVDEISSGGHTYRVAEYTALDDCRYPVDLVIPVMPESLDLYDSYGIRSLTLGSEGSTISIGEHQFANISSLKSVTFLGDVGTIGTSAFDTCTELTSVTFKGDVGTIQSNAFTRCLFEELTFEKDVGKIDPGAFTGCTALKTLVFEGTVGSIGDGAFRVCEKLASVSFNGFVEEIEEDAFNELASLKSVSFSNGAGTIGDSSFSCNAGLTEVTFKGNIGTIGKSAFNGCDNLTISFDDASIGWIDDYAIPDVDIEVDDLVSKCEGFSTLAFQNVQEYYGPGSDEVHEDDDAKFTVYKEDGSLKANIAHLQSGTVPSRVTYSGSPIPVEALYWGVAVGEVTDSEINIDIPASIKHIGSEIGHTNIRDMTSSNSSFEIIGNAEEVKSLVRYENGEAKEVLATFGSGSTYRVPDGVRNLNLNNLDGMGITEIVLSDGVETVQGSLDGLEKIHLGSSFSNFGFGISFPNLESVTVSTDNKNYSSEGGVLFNKDKTVLMLYPAGSPAESYSVPGTVTEIGSHAFSYSHLNKIELLGDIEYIYPDSFLGCNPGMTVTGMGVETVHGAVYSGNVLYAYFGEKNLVVRQGTTEAYVDYPNKLFVVLPSTVEHANIYAVAGSTVLAPSDLYNLYTGDAERVTYNTSEAFSTEFVLSGNGVVMTVTMNGNCVFEGIDYGAQHISGNSVTIDPSHGEDVTVRFDKESLTVTFDPGNSFGEVTTQTVGYGWFARWFEPQHSNAEFIGWFYENGEPFDFDTRIYDDLTLTAHWRTGWTVEYVVDGALGTCSTETATIGTGNPIVLPTVNPAEGYRFVGWTVGLMIVPEGYPVHQDMTLTAAFVSLEDTDVMVTVTYSVDPGQGRIVGEQTTSVPYGSVLVLPTVVPYGGYAFSGWYVDGAEVDRGFVVTSDVTVTAQFVRTGGGGGTAPVDPGTDPGPTVNPDGSVTTTTTTTTTDDEGNRTTTVQETTVKQDGSSTEVSTSTTEKQNSDGSRETVVVKEETMKDTGGNVMGSTKKETSTLESDTERIQTDTTTTTDGRGDQTEKVTQITAESTESGVVTSAEVREDSEGYSASSVTKVTARDEDGVTRVDDLRSAIEQMNRVSEMVGSDEMEKVIEIGSDSFTDDRAEVTLTTDALASATEAGAEVRVSGGVGSIKLSSDSAQHLAGDGGDLSLGIAKADPRELNETQAAAVGNAPVFALTASKNQERVSDLGGDVTVTVPYVLSPGEDPDRVTVFYVDDEGNLHSMRTTYDPVSHTVSFVTDHFSYYMIGTASDSPAPAEEDDGTLLYVAVAAAVIVIAAASVAVLRRRL